MKPTIIIGISGVGQLKNISNGVRDLVREVNCLGLPNVKATYYTRRVDPGELAANIKAKASIHPDTRVIFVAHSKGVQVAAETIQEYGAPVYAVVSADGWNGLARDSTLTIPGNVESVWSFRQVQGPVIRGSEIVLERPATKHVAVLVEGVKHQAIDELESVRNCVLMLAKGGTGDPRDNLDNVGL